MKMQTILNDLEFQKFKKTNSEKVVQSTHTVDLDMEIAIKIYK